MESAILSQGFVDDHRLWRRWVMAQMFRTYVNGGMKAFEDRFFRRKPYHYEWDVAERDVAAVVRMSGYDAESRGRFFSASVIRSMMEHYANEVDSVIVRDGGELTTGDRVRNFVAARLPDDRISGDGLLRAVRDFRRKFPTGLTIASPHCRWQPSKSEAWKNAFMASGAYYTMDNMVKFHGCRLPGPNAKPLDLYGSLESLDKAVDSALAMPDGGRWLMGLLSDVVEMNRERLPDFLAD